MRRWSLGQARGRRDVAETGKSDDSPGGDGVKSPIRVITAAAIFDGERIDRSRPPRRPKRDRHLADGRRDRNLAARTGRLGARGPQG